MFSNQTKQISLSQKIKSIALLLSLCFVIVGTCPIQKYILQTFSTEVEVSKQAKSSKGETKVSCTSSEQVFEAPVVETTEMRNLQSSLINSSFDGFIVQLERFQNTKIAGFSTKTEPLYSSIPIHLKNQVFII